jgi:two-component system, chemotaxis family, chemotaxis protein CheY
MKCLVVDDSTTMRRIVINALNGIGHADLVEASDGADALTKCDASIDLVVTDWNMPNMGGLELVRTLRAKPETAKVPVLMITTRGNKEDIEQAVAAGVNGYILKPFTPQLLKEKIDEVGAATGRPA